MIGAKGILARLSWEGLGAALVDACLGWRGGAERAGGS